jgi:hypothetical protein
MSAVLATGCTASLPPKARLNKLIERRDYLIYTQETIRDQIEIINAEIAELQE